MIRFYSLALAALVSALLVSAAPAEASPASDTESYLSEVYRSSYPHSEYWFLSQGFNVCDKFSSGSTREQARSEVPRVLGLGITAIVDSAANHLCPEIAPMSIYSAYGKRDASPDAGLRIKTNIVGDSGKFWHGQGDLTVFSDIDVEANRPVEIRATVNADSDGYPDRYVSCRLTRDGIVISSNSASVITSCFVKR